MRQKRKVKMKSVYNALNNHQPDPTFKINRRQWTPDKIHAQGCDGSPRAKVQALLRFSKLINAWDEPIREALNRMAHKLWPPDYAFGLIPVSTYRLRDQQIDSEIHMWWVERDVPPYEKWLCQAYQVYLILEFQHEPILTVQSGTAVYPITPPTVVALEATLTKASQDAPLIILRHQQHE